MGSFFDGADVIHVHEHLIMKTRNLEHGIVLSLFHDFFGDAKFLPSSFVDYVSDRAFWDTKKTNRIISKLQSLGHLPLTENDSGAGVYIISDGEFFKIGVANDVSKRIQDMQTGNARKLYAVYFGVTAVNPYTVEGVLHSRYEDCRIRGEWFDLSLGMVDDLKEYLSSG